MLFLLKVKIYTFILGLDLIYQLTLLLGITQLP